MDKIIFMAIHRHCSPLLTPWSRVILEKLTVAQPVKNSQQVTETFIIMIIIIMFTRSAIRPYPQLDKPNQRNCTVFVNIITPIYA